MCIHELFAEQADRTPDAIAVVYDGEQVTYRELFERSCALAWHLRDLGVGPEARVGINCERSIEAIVAMLGVLISGGAYIPLDPRYPEARLRSIVQQSAATLIFTSGATDAWPEDIRVVELPAIADQPGRERSPRLLAVDASNLAYVIYTSGSTGRPKGVALTHAGGVAFLTWAAACFDARTLEGVVASTSFNFDVSFFEVFAPLVTGGTILLIDDATRLDQLSDAPPPSLLVTVPSAMALLVDSGIPASIHTIHLAGEALGEPLVDRIFARLPGVEVVRDLYGPSEDTTYSTWTERRPGRPARIGRPIDNGRAHVLHSALSSCPVEVAGELHLAGAGLARGYLGRPALTAERFVPDPFGPPGSRMYRTGDRCRWRADGDLEFLGRLDFQVKIRGFRIELGEIEAALATHPAVRQCVVVARADDGSEQRLVAYVVGDATPVASLRAHLGESLPDYMIPSALVWLDAIPLTPNGKVDRKALPAPELDRERLSAGFVAPRTPTEAALAAIWSEVLGLDAVGVDDDFFELGGDSIISIQVVSRAARRGVVITPRQLFERPTVAGLAAVAELADGAERSLTAEQGLVEGEAPLSPIQRWFFEQGFAEAHHWNQAVCLTIPEAWDAPALSAALRSLVEHHDALRLAFDGSRAWHAPMPSSVPVEALDLSTRAPDARDEAQAAAATRMQASMRLGEPPLLRALRVDRGDEGAQLVLAIHHLVVDGVSWRVLLDDLGRACEAITRSEPVDLGPKTVSWKRWVEAQQAWATDDRAAGLDGWRAVLDAPVASLPLRDTPTAPAHGWTTVELGAERTEALLRRAGRAYRTEINDLLLTALALALRDWTGGPAVGVCLEGHGREQALLGDLDVSRTVGWFTTMFPVRLAPGADANGETGANGTSDIGYAIKAVKEQLRAVPHRGMTHGMLRWLADADGLALPPAYGVVFNYLGQVQKGAVGLGASAGPVGENIGRGNHPTSPVAFNGLVADGRLQMRVDWDRGRFEAGAVERLADGFARWLDAIIEHCLSDAAGGLTPSDVALSGLDQSALDSLCAARAGIEDIYPATPMQAGMLFHALHDPTSPAYFEQMRIGLPDDLDEAAFEAAFTAVVARHPALRTALAWRGLPRPMQVVMASVELEWQRATVDDIERWLEDDRRRAFRLDTAPLMRFAWLRDGERRRHLVWSSHHVLSDGWSLPVVMGEVLRLYTAHRRGQAVTLPRPAPYRRFVQWLEARDEAAAEAYWREALGDFTEPCRLDLPPPPAGAAGQGEHLSTLDAALGEALPRMARGHGLTLNTLFQGAWAVVLSRYTGRDDICFGVTTSGRPAEVEGVEGMVGLFINTLPLRVALPADQPLVEWLRALQSEQARARQHQATPLVEARRCAATPAGAALFDTLLVFENYPLDAALDKLGAGFAPDDVSMFEQTNYPLTLAVLPGHGLAVRATWDRAVIGDDSARRLLDHLSMVLAAMVDAPTQRLSEVEVITPAERALLAGWNDTARPFRDDVCIHELFAEQVERTPDAIAVVFEGEQLTYRALFERSCALAWHLRDLGVGPEVRVGICLERSIEMIVAMLGVSGAGGAYVPLDPASPAARMRFMIDDAGITRVIAKPYGLDERLSGLVVDPDTLDDKACRPAWPPAPATALAYVIYTSGSTGRPKGVGITHRGLTNYLQWAGPAYGIEPGTRSLAHLSIGFDASVTEIWVPLVHGGAIELIPDPDAETLASRCRRSIDVMKLTPSHLGILRVTANEWPRRLIVGGEALTSEALHALFSTDAELEVFNEYGPTETVVGSAVFSMTSAAGLDGADAPIGRAIDNHRLAVLSDGLGQLPAGPAGELYIGGAGVARGYLGRPGLTAERFVPDPLGPPGSRMYRTGDRARWRADGNLEFLGRLDFQVKIRGFRIELGEIEAALATHPAVRQCVVVARADDGSEQRLVAYIVGDAIPVASLRAYLGNSLPDYMIPSISVWLDAIPLTPNGKVDRKALPAPELDREALSMGFVAPRTPTEATLADIWSEVLGLDVVGVEDDFFEVGGHSLLTIRVSSRAAQDGLDVSPRQLIEMRTVSRLAAALDGDAPAVGMCLVRMRPTGSEPPLILLPPLGGTSMVFTPLIEALRSTLPVWAFDDPAFAGATGPETLDSLVARWVDELLAVNPGLNGVRLAGYSFGSMTAVEMARQLEARGRRVDVVLLLDGGPPREMQAFDRLEWAEEMARQLGALEAPTDVEAGLSLIAERFSSRSSASASAAAAWARALLDAAVANDRRASSWEVQVPAAPLVLLRASGNTDAGFDLGWGDAIGRPVEVLPVAGDHVTMVQAPFVQTLALCIQAKLPAAEAGVTPSGRTRREQEES